MYRIRANSRAVFITRDNNVIELTSADVFTPDEFKTLVSETEVVCVDEDTGILYTVSPTPTTTTTELAAPVIVPKETPPATDAGLVPQSVPAGSKTSKA
jgi:hypothetical protein